MSLAELFHHVTEWTADEVRAFLDGSHPEEYQLVDVRQEHEYLQQHIPGAQLIPAPDIPHRLGELDPEKTTIVYCAHGIRSQASCQIMEKAGFSKVISLKGGIRAWQGHRAVGLPKQTLAYFGRVQDAAEAAVYAWQVEENTRRFYEAVADRLTEPNAAALFAELAAAETHHKQMLMQIWEALTSRKAPQNFPEGVFVEADVRMLEGGLSLDELLTWAEDCPAETLLEMAMAMEVSAYDQYLTLYRQNDDADTRRLFELLADEERHHLRQFTEAYERHHGRGVRS